MSENAKYLETFGDWIRELGNDAEEMGELLSDAALPSDAQEAIAGGLNYMFKSLDLIPDGIDDIGYLDDAFILRVACGLASNEDLAGLSAEHLQTLGRLSNGVDLIREFLGAEYDRLEGYVKAQRRAAARGRAVADIVGAEDVRAEFLSDVRGFARTYEAPGFAREEKNLIKLKAFFDAKLPR